MTDKTPAPGPARPPKGPARKAPEPRKPAPARLLADGRFGAFAEAVAALAPEALARFSPGKIGLAISILLDAGQVNRAGALFRRASAQGKALAQSVPEVLAGRLQREGDTGQMAAIWSLWARDHPADAHAWVMAARAAQLASGPGAALGLLADLPAGLRDDPEVAAQLGLYRLLLGDRAGALQAFARAIAVDPAQPLWVHRARAALEHGTVELQGVRLEVPEGVVSAKVLRRLIDGSYEAEERGLLDSHLQPGDRVLELGAGLGFLACHVGRFHPGVPYVAVEANPDLIPLIHRNLALNDSAAEVIEGVASDRAGQTAFHRSAHFWASSTLEAPNEVAAAALPNVDIGALIQRHAPTVLVVDIEGGETDLLPRLDLGGVSRLVVELHPAMTGAAAASGLVRRLLAAGFVLETQAPINRVFTFHR